MKKIILFCLAVAQLSVAQAPAAKQRTTAKPGDAILLRVAAESLLTDTFTVTTGYNVILPTIGAISVLGVPRDSMSQHFERELSKYLKRPDVSAQVMVRIGVVGEVAKPGFYQVPVDAAFGDAVMAAGGYTTFAKVKEVKVQRDKTTLLSPNATRAALARNATVDELTLRSGDLISVPRDHFWDSETWVRVGAMLITIPLGIMTLQRMGR